MLQRHRHVSTEIAEVLRRKAKAQNVSASKFLADLVKREVGLGWQGPAPPACKTCCLRGDST